VALTGLGAVFGPVVVVPSLAMANALLFGALVDFRRPGAIVALSAGPVLLAAALQAAGWLPGGVEVRADAIVVRAGATGYEPAVVWPVMLIAAVATVALPVALLGAIRRRSDALEERLFMHSWHLRNLLPRAEGGRG
jgi:serine/threonine-protein kinase